jgi:hypothetical protein
MTGAPWVGFSVVGTWFVIAMMAAMAFVWMTTPWMIARAVRFTPARRADVLLFWRLLPSGIALWVAGLIVAPTFLRHEESGSAEAVPEWMALLTGMALLTVVVRSLRSVRAMMAVGRHLSSVTPRRLPGTSADIVETPSGTAFVAGLLRPRILLSRALVSSLTAQEFEAVIAHERAHIGARDNLKRLALLAAPDWMGMTERGRQLERTWAQAAELAADDEVAARGPRAAVDLAAALIKAARLSTAPSARLELASGMSGMFNGDELAARVTRLAAPGVAPAAAETQARLAPAARSRHSLLPALSIAAALAAALLLQITPANRALHAVSEWAVRSAAHGPSQLGR